jgi:hypothetical protein
MNWYKNILAQTYQQLMDNPENYDPDDYEANKYFSIGQNRNDGDDSFCWIYTSNGLEVAQGGTHSMNFPHLFRYGNQDTFSGYRGWYDPEQKMISVIIPRRIGQVDPAAGSSSLPTRLRTSLADKFGTDNTIKVF